MIRSVDAASADCRTARLTWGSIRPAHLEGGGRLAGTRRGGSAGGGPRRHRRRSAADADAAKGRACLDARAGAAAVRRSAPVAGSSDVDAAVGSDEQVKWTRTRAPL